MAAERFSLVIDSRTSGQAEVDKLTESIRKLSAEVQKSQARSGNSKSGSANLENIQQTIITAIQNPVQAASGAADMLIGKLGAIGGITGTAAAGAAAFAGAMFAAAEATGSLAEQQANNALRLGVTIKEYGILSQISQEAGLEADSLVIAIKGLSKALEDNGDAGSKGETALRQIGVTAKNVYGSVRPTKELLFDIADGLGRISDPADRARKAIDILGKGGISNLPILNAELRNTYAEMERFGVGFDENGAKKALKFDSALDVMGRRLDIVKRKLGELAAAGFMAGSDDPKKGMNILGLLLSPAGAGAFFALENSAASAPPDVDNKSDLKQARIDMAAMARQRRKAAIDAFLGKDPRTVLEKAQADLKKAIEDSDEKGVYAAKARVTQAEAEVQAVEKLKALKESILDLESKSGISEKNKLQLLEVAEEKEVRRAREAFAGKGDIDRIRAAFANQRNPLFEEMLAGAEERRRARDDAFGVFDLDSRYFGYLSNSSRNIGRFATHTASAFYTTSEAIGAANTEAEAAKSEQMAVRAQLQQARQLELQKQGLEVLRESLDYDARRVELMAGPGGEIAAIRTATALRLQALEQQRALGVSNLEIEKQRVQIVHDGELRILEAVKQRRAEVRDSYGQIFDAITAGRGGIQQYAKGLVLGQGRTIFQNLGEQIFGTRGGKFSLPGVGTAENPTMLGKILQGTSFGADPLKNATDQNTAATIANTNALLGGGGSVPGLFASGVATNNPLIFSQNGGGGAGGGGGLSGMLAAAGGSKGGFKGAFSQIAGLAASAGAIYGGIRQGGFGGALTAAGGAAGAAGLIAQLAGGALGKTLGQALPGLGLALGLIGSLVGSAFDPKKKRSDEIDSMISANAYKPGVGQNYGFAMFDYNKRGELRIDLTVNALDASSILDRKADIAEAVRQAVDTGHPLSDSMRDALMPA